MPETLSIAVLRDVLSYDPETGGMTWKPRDDAEWRYAGKPAFMASSQGYRRGKIFNRVYQAHRVAFALHHGHWPTGQIDHINGIRSDNRACNLRDVVQTENRRNAARNRNNTSGRVGVHFLKERNKWRATIYQNSTLIRLGTFADFDAACQARSRAETQLGYHENHGRAD